MPRNYRPIKGPFQKRFRPSVFLLSNRFNVGFSKVIFRWGSRRFHHPCFTRTRYRLKVDLFGAGTEHPSSRFVSGIGAKKRTPSAAPFISQSQPPLTLQTPLPFVFLCLLPVFFFFFSLKKKKVKTITRKIIMELVLKVSRLFCHESSSHSYYDIYLNLEYKSH